MRKITKKRNDLKFCNDLYVSTVLVNGYQKCAQGQCYGVMRVPVDRANTTVAPDSRQAIDDGVKWLTEIATCARVSKKG